MPVVLGGGISGLAAGYYLARRFVNPITIYEASNRVGGWIRSEVFEDKNFVLEAGPRTIRTKGPAAINTLNLLDELNLKSHVSPVCATHPAVKNRLIYAKGELCLLPNSIGGVIKTIPPFTKPLILALLHDLRTVSKKQKLDDESIYDFAARRFGTEIAEYAISPMICGICAGDAKQISVRFLMNDLFEWEQKYGSVVKGIFLGKRKTIFPKSHGALSRLAKEQKWSIFSMKGGLEMLPKALSEFLKQYADVKVNSQCKQITFKGDGTAEVMINGHTYPTDHVISTIPTFELATAVEHQHPTLACQLNTITYVDVAVVNLQYNTPDVLQYNAFGFLVPPIEKRPILGVIFDSCCFDMRGNTVLTCMMGGHWFDSIFGKKPSQKDVLDIAVQNVRTILDITKDPTTTRVHILRKCIPQYTVGHKVRVEEIRNYIDRYSLPLTLCGAAYDGVGVNDVIMSAKNQVDRLVGCA